MGNEKLNSIALKFVDKSTHQKTISLTDKFVEKSTHQETISLSDKFVDKSIHQKIFDGDIYCEIRNGNFSKTSHMTILLEESSF